MVSDKEPNEQLGEETSSPNFTMLLTLFAKHMAGSVDDN